MLLGLSLSFFGSAFVPAHALAVSEPLLQSTLGQRLDVRVPLDGDFGRGELRARLLAPSEYERLGMQAPDLYGLNIRAEVESESGLYWVHLRSGAPVREPLLVLLLEVSSGTVRVVRELPLLLDTPDFDAPSATAVARAEPALPARIVPEERIVPEVVRAPRPPAMPAVREVPSAPARLAALPAGPQGTYGPVRRGDTLWGIAKRLRATPDADPARMVAAIVAANPQLAEHKGNLLRVGGYLQIPGVEGIDLARLSPSSQEDAPAPSISTSTPAAAPASAPAPAPNPVTAVADKPKPAMELGRIPEPMPVAAQMRMSDSLTRVDPMPIRLQPIAAAEALVPSKALNLGNGTVATLQPLPEMRARHAPRGDGGARWMNVAALAISLLALAITLFRRGATLR